MRIPTKDEVREFIIRKFTETKGAPITVKMAADKTIFKITHVENNFYKPNEERRWWEDELKTEFLEYRDHFIIEGDPKKTHIFALRDDEIDPYDGEMHYTTHMDYNRLQHVLRWYNTLQSLNVENILDSTHTKHDNSEMVVAYCTDPDDAGPIWHDTGIQLDYHSDALILDESRPYAGQIVKISSLYSVYDEICDAKEAHNGYGVIIDVDRQPKKTIMTYFDIPSRSVYTQTLYEHEKSQEYFTAIEENILKNSKGE